MFQEGGEGVDLFRGVTEEQLTRLLHGLVPRMFWADAVIINEGDPGDSMFVVLNGSVRVVTGLGTKTEVKIADRLIGQLVGEVNFVSGGVRSATVIANEASIVIEFEKTHILAEMEKDLALARQLTWNIAQVLADRLRAATAKVGHPYPRVLSEETIERLRAHAAAKR
ncbi:MAG: cyclic nucleotide-binding domain-containing protein [Candidatus Magasanikbacteria bacterium]|nr:cyclic nucleotide-binding domain-containing protein [Candidatus Magasanikbacteria bacterium]